MGVFEFKTKVLKQEFSLLIFLIKYLYLLSQCKTQF